MDITKPVNTFIKGVLLVVAAISVFKADWMAVIACSSFVAAFRFTWDTE